MPNEVTYPNSVTEEPLPDSGNAPQGQAEEAAAEPSSAPGLTLEQVQAAIEKALAGSRKDIDRSLQSQLDKRDAGLRKQIETLRQQANQFADTAKAGGIEEAQAKQLGQAYFNSQLDALMEEQKPPTKGNGKPQADGETEEPDEQTQVAQYQQYVTSTGDRLRRAAGLELSDPEMRTIITDRDEQAYYDSIEAAGKAKAERLKAESKRGQPARTPGLGTDGGRASRNPIQGVENAGELYKLAAEQERTARQRG